MKYFRFMAVLIAVCIFIGVISIYAVRTNANGDNLETLEVQGVKVKIKRLMSKLSAEVAELFRESKWTTSLVNKTHPLGQDP